MIRLEIKKIQYDINKEAAKKSILSYGKIEKYDYLTSEERLPFHQRRVIEKAQVYIFSFRKSFRKTSKNN